MSCAVSGNGMVSASFDHDSRSNSRNGEAKDSRSARGRAVWRPASRRAGSRSGLSPLRDPAERSLDCAVRSGCAALPSCTAMPDCEVRSG